MLAPGDRGPMAFVFSHPNHELPVLGLFRRVGHRVVYLTDGGGPDRVAETKNGLARLGMLAQARFLNYPENSFYEALLKRDVAYFKGVAAALRACLEDVRPARIACDAVEFYNPLHDLTLPIVQACCRAADGCDLYEIPLIYQRQGPGENCAIQELPPHRRGSRIEFALSDAEHELKAEAYTGVYAILRAQLGATLAGYMRERAGVEILVPAGPSVPQPETDQILRYEWRARLLKARGLIEEIITLDDHLRPVASGLLAQG